MYDQSARKAGGCMIITDPSLGTVEHVETVQCCHCDSHKTVAEWRSKGGMCRFCMKPHCGETPCVECKPFERKLEEFEAGKIDKL